MNESYRKHYQEAKEHNGWTNYPTRAVHLWISNDQGTWEHWIDRARCSTGEVHALENALRDEHADGQPDMNSVYADLMGWALQFVNWREIAESLVEAAQS